MKRVFVLILAMAVCLTPAAASDDLHSEQYRNLAEYWALTIYQDVNDSYLTRADIPHQVQLRWGLTRRQQLGEPRKLSPDSFCIFFCARDFDPLSAMIQWAS